MVDYLVAGLIWVGLVIIAIAVFLFFRWLYIRLRRRELEMYAHTTRQALTESRQLSEESKLLALGLMAKVEQIKNLERESFDVIFDAIFLPVIIGFWYEDEVAGGDGSDERAISEFVNRLENDAARADVAPYIADINRVIERRARAASDHDTD